MNAAWGVIDLIIAGLGSRNIHVVGDGVEGLVHIMLLNVAFNCGYIAVGITMVALAGPRRRIWQCGAAVIVQGVILLALDGYFANTMPFWLAPGWKL